MLIRPTSNFQPVRIMYLVTNSADPNQLASDLDLHFLQRQCIFYTFCKGSAYPDSAGPGLS